VASPKGLVRWNLTFLQVKMHVVAIIEKMACQKYLYSDAMTIKAWLW